MSNDRESPVRCATYIKTAISFRDRVDIAVFLPGGLFNEICLVEQDVIRIVEAVGIVERRADRNVKGVPVHKMSGILKSAPCGIVAFTVRGIRDRGKLMRSRL